MITVIYLAVVLLSQGVWFTWWGLIIAVVADMLLNE